MVIKIDEKRLKGMIQEIITETLYGTLPKHNIAGNMYSVALEGKPYLIKEGLIETYPIERVIFSLSGLFDLYSGDDPKERNRVLYTLDHGNDCKYNGTIEIAESKNETQRIEIKVSRKAFNQVDFDKYLLKYGWFCGFAGRLFGYTDMVQFIYEKKFDVEVTDAVMKKRYIYHICPNIYLNRINWKGLKPKFSSWNRFSNPERIYFFLKDIPHDTFIVWVNNFKEGKNINNTDDGWSLLRIDTASLTNNPSFYFDPRMKDGIYTMDNISPESIEIIDFIKGEI